MLVSLGRGEENVSTDSIAMTYPEPAPYDEPTPDTIDLDEDPGPATDLVRAYLSDIGRTPLLSAAEEVDLAKRIEVGLFAARKLAEPGKSRISAKRRAELERIVADGQEAKAHMLRANLRLVVSVAKKHSHRGIPFLDVVQVGNLGLIRAVEKFDYRRGFKFSTYAMWWIRQAINRGLAEQSRTIRLPVHVVENVNRLRAIERRLGQELGRDPTITEVAEEVGESEERVAELRRVSRDPVSLDMAVGDDEDTVFGDLVEDSDALLAAEAVERSVLMAGLRRAVADLPERESRLLTLRYGLADGRTRSLEEVGRELGLTRERIRQLEKESLHRLRDSGAAG